MATNDALVKALMNLGCVTTPYGNIKLGSLCGHQNQSGNPKDGEIGGKLQYGKDHPDGLYYIKSNSKDKLPSGVHPHVEIYNDSKVGSPRICFPKGRQGGADSCLLANKNPELSDLKFLIYRIEHEWMNNPQQGQWNSNDDIEERRAFRIDDWALIKQKLLDNAGLQNTGVYMTESDYFYYLNDKITVDTGRSLWDVEKNKKYGNIIHRNWLKLPIILIGNDKLTYKSTLQQPVSSDIDIRNVTEDDKKSVLLELEFIIMNYDNIVERISREMNTDTSIIKSKVTNALSEVESKLVYQHIMDRYYEQKEEESKPLKVVKEPDTKIKTEKKYNIEEIIRLNAAASGAARSAEERTNKRREDSRREREKEHLTKHTRKFIPILTEAADAGRSRVQAVKERISTEQKKKRKKRQREKQKTKDRDARAEFNALPANQFARDNARYMDNIMTNGGIMPPGVFAFFIEGSPYPVTGTLESIIRYISTPDGQGIRVDFLKYKDFLLEGIELLGSAYKNCIILKLTANKNKEGIFGKKNKINYAKKLVRVLNLFIDQINKLRNTFWREAKITFFTINIPSPNENIRHTAPSDFTSEMLDIREGNLDSPIESVPNNELKKYADDIIDNAPDPSLAGGRRTMNKKTKKRKRIRKNTKKKIRLVERKRRNTKKCLQIKVKKTRRYN